MITTLKEATNSKKYGNKASTLAILKNQNFSVPDGLVIAPNLLVDLLSKNSVVNKLTKLGTFEFKQKIMQSIDNLVIPSELFELVRNFFDTSDYLIVRSNFSDEDGRTESNAGTYESVGPITNDPRLIENAIKNVWKSYYYVNSTISDTNSVIIQRYIDFDISGVGFTIDPITGTKKNTIEYSSINGGVEKGDTPTFNLYKDYKGKDRHSDQNERAILTKSNSTKLDILLERIKKSVQHTLGEELDVEWGIFKNKLYVIQVRPITKSGATVPKLVEKEPLFLSLDSPEVPTLNLDSFYENLVRKHWKKRHWMKEHAKSQKFSVYHLGFLFFSISQLKNHPQSIQNIINDELHTSLLYIIFKVDTKKYEMVLKKSDFSSYLEKIYTSSIYTDSDYGVVWATEFIIPDVSGFSSSDKKGNVSIEYTLGDVLGLKHGEVSFSRYLLNDKDDVIHNFVAVSKYFYSFDDDYSSVQIKNSEKLVPKLVDADIAVLTRMGRSFFTNSGSNRVEWVKKDSKIYIYDLSLDENGDDSPILNDNVIMISQGLAEGKIFNISAKEIESLEKSVSHFLSVQEDTSEIQDIMQSSIVKQLKVKITKEHVDVIIHAAYPSVLLSAFFALEEVKGFVFDSGASMSHLGIKLRENSIPAAILAGKNNLITKDVRYRLYAGLIEEI